MTLNADAREIIRRAARRTHSHEYIARFYGISRPLVDLYLTDDAADCGPLTARKVLRVEIARLNAKKEGKDNFFPGDRDRYKGTRGAY